MASNNKDSTAPASEKPDGQGKNSSKEAEKPQRRNTFTHKKGKFDPNEVRGGRYGRKRSQSYPSGNMKFFPPFKRRKKDGHMIPPTKFLLGGNIYDPLNLNSLQDEETNRVMNAVTPKSSPMPTPKHRRGTVEVIIPPNLKDPLNLSSCDDDSKYEQELVSPTKRCRKQKHRKRKRHSSGSVSKVDTSEAAASTSTATSTTTVSSTSSATSTSTATIVSSTEDNQADINKREENLQPEKNENIIKESKSSELPQKNKERKDFNKRPRKFEIKDKIVSPVIPQPGAWKRPPPMGGDNRFNRFRHKRGGGPQTTPKFKEKDAYFQYGNYLKYYGYRNLNHTEDVRLKCFEDHKEMFADKDILDIGCNIGHVTLTIARDFGAKTVVGLDIDRKLIAIARKNIKHYVIQGHSSKDDQFYPISMPIEYGPIIIPGQSPSPHKRFPQNVSFIHGNYILDSDALLDVEQQQFNVILCLSLTKWIHLNWGDAGLKQAFKRMFLQLFPGGKLILEAQSFDSYNRKKKLTERIFNNYKSIKLFPHKFTQYLLSSEVGFTKCEVIGTPLHQSKGFRRPIRVFTKGESPIYSLISGVPLSSRRPVYTAMSSRDDEDETEDMEVTEQTQERNAQICDLETDNVFVSDNVSQKSTPEYVECCCDDKSCPNHYAEMESQFEYEENCSEPYLPEIDIVEGKAHESCSLSTYFQDNITNNGCEDTCSDAGPSALLEEEKSPSAPEVECVLDPMASDPVMSRETLSVTDSYVSDVQTSDSAKIINEDLFIKKTHKSSQDKNVQLSSDCPKITADEKENNEIPILQINKPDNLREDDHDSPRDPEVNQPESEDVDIPPVVVISSSPPVEVNSSSSTDDLISDFSSDSNSSSQDPPDTLPEYMNENRFRLQQNAVLIPLTSPTSYNGGIPHDSSSSDSSSSSTSSDSSSSSSSSSDDDDSPDIVQRNGYMNGLSNDSSDE